MSWDTENTWNTGLPTPEPTYRPRGYVYRPPRNPYIEMSPAELDRKIAETEEKLRLMRETRESYGENPTVLYECEECNNRFMTADECIEHLEDIHGYPYEDAGLSTKRVYVRV